MSEVLVYHIASGQAFFVGAALVLLALVLSLWPPRRGGKLGRLILAWGGLLWSGASATPLPTWLWGAAVGVTLAWVGIEGSTHARLHRVRPWLRGGVVAAWGFGVAWESPYHLSPTLPPLADPPLYVVGDSVSAGTGEASIETWPRRLGRTHGVVVHGLSIVGATVTSAAQQAALVRESKALVLAEIGGNDILAGTPPEVFERDLDALLTQLHGEGRTVVLLELPLPPFFNRYGAIQRRLARRHGTILVPKRVLLGVLTAPDATVDSIHLTQAGQQRMTDAMWRVLRPAYRRGLSSATNSR